MNIRSIEYIWQELVKDTNQVFCMYYFSCDHSILSLQQWLFSIKYEPAFLNFFPGTITNKKNYTKSFAVRSKVCSHNNMNTALSYMF